VQISFSRKQVQWTPRPGQGRDVGAGPGQQAWLIGTNPVPGGFGIHRWTGSTWDPVPGGADRIAVSPEGTPWVVNLAGEIFRWDGKGWQPLPGGAKDIGVGTLDQAWIIGTNAVSGGFGIYRWTGCAWQAMPGGAMRIAVSPEGSPWIINQAGEVFRWGASNWTLVPAVASDIAVGPNEQAWIVGTNPAPGGKSVSRWNGTAFDIVNGGATAIAVSPEGRPWVVNESGNIFSGEVVAPPATLMPIRPAAAPTNVTITQTTPTTVTVTWTAPPGVTKFSIGASSSAGRVALTPGEVSGNAATLRGPMDYRLTYELMVTAIYADGKRASSAPITFQPASPGVPSWAKAEQRGSDVVVSWAPVPGAECYAVASSDVSEYRMVPAPQTSVTYTNVTQGSHAWGVSAEYNPGHWQLPGDKWSRATLSVAPSPIRGFADLHNHIFANLAFGGLAFHGRAFGPIDQSLPWCDQVHGAGGTGDILGETVRRAIYGARLGWGHAVGGFPEFDGWPRWDNITHQAVHEDSLKRAVDGGLRLMVALAVNNVSYCEKANKAPGRTCTDDEAVDRQLDEAYEMQSVIDAKSGGPGQGWFRIVTSAQQARKAMNEGKLAVVLGVEVDDPLGCGSVGTPWCWYRFANTATCGYPPPSKIASSCDQDTMRAKLDAWYARGIRYFFPVHFADNAFGGTALQNGLEWPVSEQLGDGASVVRAPVIPPFDRIGAFTTVQTENCADRGFDANGGKCNARGLTPLGKQLVREMAKRAMIIDVDHMSWHSKDDVFALLDQMQYPAVVSGHSGFIDISLGEKKHEGQLTAEQTDRITQLGGMISVILNQGGIGDIATYSGAATRVPHRCGNSVETFAQAYLYAASKSAAVAFGTDYNGMIPPFGPRLGPERCNGGTNSTQPILNPQVEQPMSYAYNAIATGVVMPASSIGRRTFDIATDGPAHVGMLPDVVADLEWIGLRPSDLDPLLNSAEGFVKMWEKAEARAPALQ
jgi:microsomal dipeptidase-like Zn-dependent dipeptidase